MHILYDTEWEKSLRKSSDVTNNHNNSSTSYRSLYLSIDDIEILLNPCEYLEFWLWRVIYVFALALYITNWLVHTDILLRSYPRTMISSSIWDSPMIIYCMTLSLIIDLDIITCCNVGIFLKSMKTLHTRYMWRCKCYQDHPRRLLMIRLWDPYMHVIL